MKVRVAVIAGWRACGAMIAAYGCTDISARFAADCCISLSPHGTGSPCFPHIIANPHIQLHPFTPPSFSLANVRGGRVVRLALAPVKVLRQVVQLLQLLLFGLYAKP